jgi:hypothetical protein
MCSAKPSPSFSNRGRRIGSSRSTTLHAEVIVDQLGTLAGDLS